MDISTVLGLLLVGAFAGAAAGAWGYRYWLKRDPAALERWAQELKRRGDELRTRLEAKQ